MGVNRLEDVVFICWFKSEQVYEEVFRVPFDDLMMVPRMGERFSFNDQVWIVYSVHTYHNLKRIEILLEPTNQTMAQFIGESDHG